MVSKLHEQWTGEGNQANGTNDGRYMEKSLFLPSYFRHVCCGLSADFYVSSRITSSNLDMQKTRHID